MNHNCTIEAKVAPYRHNLTTYARVGINGGYFDVFVYELLRRLFRIGNFCFWVPFLKQLLLRNCAVDFVEICSVYVGKMIIKSAKRIFHSDKICRSYSDLNFGITFFGTQCIYTSDPAVTLLIFTALHGMQTRFSDEKAVRPSVRPSVRHTRVLWQNGRKICPDLYTVWKNI